MDDSYIDKPEGICQKCNKRQATVFWTEGILSFTHGFRESWCEVCAIREQLRHAKELSKKIPTLEAELKSLLDAENV